MVNEHKIHNGLIINDTTAVNAILDEYDLISNSATSLATQRSIKSYVDEVRQYLSAGLISIPSWTDHGNGTATVGSGVARLFELDDGYGPLKEFHFNSLLCSFTDLTTNYVILSYNGGTPVLSVTTNVLDINETTVIPTYTVARCGLELHYMSWDSMALALSNKIHYRLVKTRRFEREYGVNLSESSTRIVNISSGKIFYGAQEVAIEEFNSSIDDLEIAYHVGGVWTKTPVTQYDNYQYDDGTNLVALSPNRYAVNWVYRGVESEKHTIIVLGSGDYRLNEATGSQPPAVPNVVSSHMVLVGRIIVQNGSSVATEIDSAWAVSFSPAEARDHNDLLNIQGGVPNQYYHLSSLFYDYATHSASNSQDGYLKSSDWNTFNNKITDPMTTAGDLIYRNGSNITDRLALGLDGYVLSSNGTDVLWKSVPAAHDAVTLNQSAVTGGLSLNNQEINARAATALVDGYLKHVDWSTFNSKEPAQTKGSISSITPSAITIANGTSSTVGPNVTISINKASTFQDGYLGNDDWNTFNNKMTDPMTTAGDLIYRNGSNLTDRLALGIDGYVLASNGTTVFWKSVPGVHDAVTLNQSAITGGLSLNGQEISFRAADTNVDGYLKSSDWNTFNSKEPAVTKGNLTSNTTSAITITSGTGSVIGTGTSITINKSSASSDGYLGKDDWSTFNNKVPYTGATSDVELGTHKLGVERIQFSLNPTVGAHSDGKMYWDTTWKTGTLELEDDVRLQIGQETMAYVYNGTGSPLINGHCVYISGSQSGIPSVSLAQANSDATSFVLGIITSTTINDGYYGYATIRGHVNNLNTNSWNVGDSLYLSPDSAGQLTNVQPSGGNYDVRVGRVMIKDPSTGRIYVNIRPQSKLTDLSDVTITIASVDDTLRFNGVEWVNGAPATSSASPGIEFFPDTTDIIAKTDQNAFVIETLNKYPVTTTESVEAINCTNNTVIGSAYLYDVSLGRTTIDAGNWSFDIYSSVSSVGGGRISTLTFNLFAVSPYSSTTVTTTDLTATSKTCTASGGTPFAVGKVVGSATNTTASYVQTPKGAYQILTVVSDTVCTIEVPSTYTNESNVAFSTWRKLFGVTSPTITNLTTNYGLYSINSAQSAFTVDLTDKFGLIVFGTSNNTTTVNYVYNGTTRYSHFTTPLITLHNNLAGLQGGTSNQFYHLDYIHYLTSNQKATSSVDGYLSRADWSTFNSKEPAVTKGNLTSNTTSAITITSGTGAVIGTGTSITINKSSASVDGYLGKDDWSTFNSKEPALTKGNLTETVSSILTITSGTGAVIGSGTTIQAKKASLLQDGYLGKDDFAIFSTSGHDPVTLNASAITGGLSLNSQEISFRAADTNVDGYLKSADWDTFNGKANSTLSNLGSVAINTTLLPGSNDGAGLGNGTYSFSDLFLATGGVVNWANGNATLTHSTGILTFNTVKLATGGETAPDVDAGGLCLNHGAGTDSVLTVKSSSVAHPFTTFAQTDTYGELRRHVSASGGLLIRGFTEATTGLEYRGYAVTASTDGYAAIQLTSYLTDGGTSVTAFSNNSNIVGFRNNAVMKHVFKGGGDAAFVGALTIGSRVGTGVTAGTIQWSGTNFEGYNGSAWVDLDAAGSIPTTITIANEASDTTCFPLFVTAATGDLGPKTNANFAFNSSTGALGIGTSPSYPLHISGSGDQILYINSTDDNADIYLSSVRAAYARLSGVFSYNSGTQVSFIGTYVDGDTDAGNLVLQTRPTSGTLTNRLVVYSNGSIVCNEDGIATADFRIESDSQTHMFFLDSSADSIGIANSSPSALLTLGTAGTKAGSLSLAGAASGVVTIDVASAAGTWTLTLPTNDGNSGQVLQTNGSGVCSWSDGYVDKIVEGNSRIEVRDTGSDGYAFIVTEGVKRLDVTSDGYVNIYGNLTAETAYITENHDGYSARVVNVMYGTGNPPAGFTSTPYGTIYIKHE